MSSIFSTNIFEIYNNIKMNGKILNFLGYNIISKNDSIWFPN